MANGNVSIVGNLTRDPELIQSDGRKPRTRLSVAVNEGRDDNQKTHFINVTVFGDMAVNVAESLSIGQRVMVSGRFDSYKQAVEIDGVTKEIQRLGLIADAIGPDLRWAKVKVTKVTRDHDDNDEAPAPSKSSNKSKSSKASKVEETDDEDF